MPRNHTKGKRCAMDLIGRQAAIDAIESDIAEIDPLDIDYGMKKACIRRAAWKVEQVPSAEPEKELKKEPKKEPNEWIPVSERLPQYGNYLVSFRTNEEIDIGTYHPETGLWSACDADGFYYVASRGLEVVAWMQLPEPYQEVEHE